MCPIPEGGDMLPLALVTGTLPCVPAPAMLSAEMPVAALRAQDPMGSQGGCGPGGKSPHCQKNLSPQPKAKLGAGRCSAARRLKARARRRLVLQAPRSSQGWGSARLPLGMAGGCASWAVIPQGMATSWGLLFIKLRASRSR